VFLRPGDGVVCFTLLKGRLKPAPT
jgi:hypothetical protein